MDHEATGRVLNAVIAAHGLDRNEPEQALEEAERLQYAVQYRSGWSDTPSVDGAQEMQIVLAGNGPTVLARVDYPEPSRPKLVYGGWDGEHEYPLDEAGANAILWLARTLDRVRTQRQRGTS